MKFGSLAVMYWGTQLELHTWKGPDKGHIGNKYGLLLLTPKEIHFFFNLTRVLNFKRGLKVIPSRSGECGERVKLYQHLAVRPSKQIACLVL